MKTVGKTEQADLSDNNRDKIGVNWRPHTEEGDRDERHTQLAYSHRLPVNLCSHMIPCPPAHDQ